MANLDQISPQLYRDGLAVLVVVIFLSLKLLLEGNMNINEVDVLPLARQHTDPSWIPGDWYLNQPAGYRRLFELVFGPLTVAWGFLAASIVGRLVCYVLVALGLVLISRSLGLTLWLLLLALGFFLYGEEQSIVAGEWMVRGLEAKAPAYGFVLLAIALMLRSRYRLMALLLGVATSFHVLVGGWSVLAIGGWIGLKRKDRLKPPRSTGILLLLYLAGSIFAVKPMLDQLFTAAPASSVPASFIYVFLRLPHHLNPLVWPSEWWIKFTIYVLLLVASIDVLRQLQKTEELARHYQAGLDLFGITMLSLLPFLVGLLVAPFDRQGQFLQFYPFRLGDVLLPLAACLLVACVLQQGIAALPQKRTLSLICIGFISALCCVQTISFVNNAASLKHFPRFNSEFEALCSWVRTHTPTEAVVVTPPSEVNEFTWLAERPTIAKYKLLPQTKAGITDWYNRLSNLGGGSFPDVEDVRYVNREQDIRRALAKGYYRLKTASAVALMDKYQARYFLTRPRQKLRLPIAYRNAKFVLYQREKA